MNVRMPKLAWRVLDRVRDQFHRRVYHPRVLLLQGLVNQADTISGVYRRLGYDVTTVSTIASARTELGYNRFRIVIVGQNGAPQSLGGEKAFAEELLHEGRRVIYIVSRQRSPYNNQNPPKHVYFMDDLGHMGPISIVRHMRRNYGLVGDRYGFFL